MAIPPTHVDPKSVGRYDILNRLGESNDIVYEAYDPVCDRRLAIKEALFPEGMADWQKQDKIERFRREAKTGSALHHPNIMEVYDYVEQDDRYFIVLEYLDGNSLASQMKNLARTYSLTEILELMDPLLQALQHAHERFVIHRDLKPANLQILRNGGLKIMDFGIAKFTDPNRPNVTTVSGMMWGTVHYSSPEQIQGKTLDLRSDLFSVGIIIYRLLAGQLPFEGNDDDESMRQIINAEPLYTPSNVFSREMVAFLKKSLAKKPDGRFQSAEEMLQALKQIVLPVAKPFSIAQSLPVQSPQMVAPQIQANLAANPIILPAPSQITSIRYPEIWRWLPLVSGLVSVATVLILFCDAPIRVIVGAGYLFLGVFWTFKGLTRKGKIMPGLASKGLLTFVGLVVISANFRGLSVGPSTSNTRKTPGNSGENNSAKAETKASRSSERGTSAKQGKTSNITAGSRKVLDRSESQSNPETAVKPRKKQNTDEDEKPLRNPSHDAEPEASPGTQSSPPKSDDDDPPLRGGG